MTAVVAALAVVVAVLALLVVGLLRSHAEILRRLHVLDADGPATTGGPAAAEGPAAGATGGTGGEAVVPSRRQRAGRTAADVVGQTPEGDAVALRVAGVDHDTLLLFLSSGCVTCGEFWDGLVAGRVVAPPGTRVAVVTRGAAHESPATVADLAPAGVPLVMSDEAWTDHRVSGSPYAVHVDGASGRVVGEGTGQDWTQVARLLAEATGDAAYAGPRGRRAGSPPGVPWAAR